MVKGWGGFVGGSRFKFQWGQKIYLYKKKESISFKVHAFILTAASKSICFFGILSWRKLWMVKEILIKRDSL